MMMADTVCFCGRYVALVGIARQIICDMLY